MVSLRIPSLTIEVDDMRKGDFKTDRYTNSVIESMYADPTTRILDGDSVDGDGNLGWFSYANGEKLIAGFKKIKNNYIDKIKGWFDDSKEISRELFKALIYKHECAEEKDYIVNGGRTPHGELEVRNLQSTPKGTDMEMAEMAVTELGLKQGTEQAREVASISNIRNAIRGYKNSLTRKALEKYEMFMDNVAEMVGIREPAYATVGVD
jgi:hypothetical protein